MNGLHSSPVLHAAYVPLETPWPRGIGLVPDQQQFVGSLQFRLRDEQHVPKPGRRRRLRSSSARPTSTPPRVGRWADKDKTCMPQAASKVPKMPRSTLHPSRASSNRQTDTMMLSEKWRYVISREKARLTESLTFSGSRSTKGVGVPHSLRQSLNPLRHNIKNAAVSRRMSIAAVFSSSD
jgi:hypothetical protein